MGNEKDQLITSRFGNFILGGVPPVPPVPAVGPGKVEATEVNKDIGLPPGTTPDGFAAYLNNDKTFKAYRENADWPDYPFGGDLTKYADYLKEAWLKNEKARKNYMTWDTLQNLMFLAVHEAKNPDQKQKAVDAFMKNFKGYAEAIKQLGIDGKPGQMADAQRRYAALAGMFLKDLKSDGQAHAEETLILTLLRDNYKGLDEAIAKQDAPTQAKMKPIREYSKARALFLDIALAPSDGMKPGEMRKKVLQIKDHLKAAKEALNNESTLKDSYQPLIDAEIEHFPTVRSDSSMAREFITRNSASFIMMVASEIDMEEGDSQETVRKRYEALTTALTAYIEKNPETTFANALDQISSSEAGHLKSLFAKHAALRDLKEAEKISGVLTHQKEDADSLVGNWANQVVSVIKDHSALGSKIVESGEFHAASYQEILRQFVGIPGVKLSPFSQAYQDFVGTVPANDDKRMNVANSQIRDMNSTTFKIGNGFAHAISWKTLVFAGAASVLQRGSNMALMGAAGESGSFGRGIFQLVRNGEMTGLGHFTSGTLTGIGLTLGGAGYQFYKDSSASRETHFWHDMAVGSLISTAGLGFAQVGNYGLKRFWLQPRQLKAAEKGIALPWYQRVTPYIAHVGIATGGMVGASALYRGLWHNPQHPTEKVPLASWDETTEIALNMIAMNMVELAPLHRLLTEKQLGKFRTKELNTLTDEIMSSHYGAPGQSSPFAKDVNLTTEAWSIQRKVVFNRLALHALRGTPLKDLKTDPFKAYVAKSLNLPGSSGSLLARTQAGPKAPVPAAAKTYIAEDGAEIQVGIRLGSAKKLPGKHGLKKGDVIARVTEVEQPDPQGPAKVTLRVEKFQEAGSTQHVIEMSAAEVAAHKIQKDITYRLGAYEPKDLTPLPIPGAKITGTAGLPQNVVREISGEAYTLRWVHGDPRRTTAAGDHPNATVMKVEATSHDPNAPVRVEIEWTNPKNSKNEKLTFEMPVEKADELQIDEGEAFVVSRYIPPVTAPPTGGQSTPPPAPPAPPATPAPGGVAPPLGAASPPPPPSVPGGSVPGGKSGPPPLPGAKGRTSPPPPPPPPARRPSPVPPLPEGVFKTMDNWTYEIKPVDPSHEAMAQMLTNGFRMVKVKEVVHNQTATEIQCHLESLPGPGGKPESLVFQIPREKADPLGIQPNAVLFVRHYTPTPVPPPPPAPPPTPKVDPIPVVLAIEGNAFDANNTWQPRRAQVKQIIPGVGEVAGFTHEGIDKGVLSGQRTNPVNEDAFGFDPNTGVIVVGDGMGGLGNGDLASNVTVKSVISLTSGGKLNLGKAFLQTHEDVFSSCQGGSCAATAIRPLPDGTVEVANAGDTRVLILRPQSDGSYDVIEPYPPDTLATFYRVNPPQTPEARQHLIDYYNQMNRGLDAQDFNIGNTLQLNASGLNTMVRSGLGLPELKVVAGKRQMGPMGLTLVPELDFSQTSKHGQVLHTILSVHNPANPSERIPYRSQEGDVLLLISDGVADLVNKQQLGQILKGQTDVAKMSGMLQRISEKFMSIYNIHSLDLPEGERGALPGGGFIDAKGNVYRTNDPADTEIMAHFGPDNITAVLLRFGLPKIGPKGPPSEPPKADPGAPTPSEGVKAPDSDDVTTQQFSRSEFDPEEGRPTREFRRAATDDPHGSFIDPMDAETTMKRPGSRTGPLEPVTEGEGEMCVAEPPPVAVQEFDPHNSTTLVSVDPFRVKKVLEERRAAWLEAAKDSSVRYVLFDIMVKSGDKNLAYSEGRFVDKVTQCSENQLLLQFETGPDGQRTLTQLDATLNHLPKELRDVVDMVFPPIPVLEIEPDAASGARPLPEPPPPAPPAVPEAVPVPIAETKGRKGDETRQISLETTLALHIQDALTPYFTELQKGVTHKGKVFIYKVDNTYLARWQPEGAKDHTPPPEGKLAAIVEVRGDLTSAHENTYLIVPSPVVQNNKTYKAFLAKVKVALDQATLSYFRGQQGKK